MKTVILCGGRGTRLGEHGKSVPKALVEIGGKPILWHLLKTYSNAGLDDFVLCLGYLGEQIREYFIDDGRSVPIASVLPDSETVRFRPDAENWTITLLNTGLDTNTGARLKRAGVHLQNEKSFCVTYGDGLADVDLKGLISFHNGRGKTGTLTAIQPFSSFGVLEIDDDEFVTEFREKPRIREWINGGFFVFERSILDYLDEGSVLEKEPLKTLASKNELSAFKHRGFWKCMDTYKDNLEFNEMWNAGNARWKVW
ncbi:MAG: NTP transferase domain-containing protein [Acidobacteria bacterium]|nr:NTP transferase domain-containing protein [Acidobacteriota bacterium]